MPERNEENGGSYLQLHLFPGLLNFIVAGLVVVGSLGPTELVRAFGSRRGWAFVVRNRDRLEKLEEVMRNRRINLDVHTYLRWFSVFQFDLLVGGWFP
jgi:hypothetical protein